MPYLARQSHRRCIQVSTTSHASLSRRVYIFRELKAKSTEWPNMSVRSEHIQRCTHAVLFHQPYGPTYARGDHHRLNG